LKLQLAALFLSGLAVLNK